MEFRSQKAVGASALALAGMFAARLAAQAPPQPDALRPETPREAGMAAPSSTPGQDGLRYEARHEHLRKACKGNLRITAEGISFDQTDAKKPSKRHVFEWRYPDIQQLEIAPGRLRVLTYRDDKWKLGSDREYTFVVSGPGDLRAAYAMLKDKLDQRFVAALADEGVKPLWQVPAKHLTRFGGTEGLLTVSADRIVFQALHGGESRTWRFMDIDNISTSGPFQFTLTSYERALSHYGNLKGFNFQLKEPLLEARYDDLWRSLNQSKGMRFLISQGEKGEAK